jgi:UPF0271 protein
MNQINNDPFLSRQIDLNLNIGQSYGDELIELDLMQYATSVNVSTGAHAGDPAYINKSLQACRQHENLSIGALISYPDLLGFGMRKIQLSNEELKASIIAQLGALAALAKINQYELMHVRPHGYLYHQMAANYSVAETVAKAVQEFSKWLIMIGPYSNVLREVSAWTNVRIAFEARFDLRYRNDASLISFERDIDGELPLDLVSQRARDLVYKSSVLTDDKEEVGINFESIHLPSRLKNAEEVAKTVRAMVLKPLPIKSIDYEPYLSEFI